MSRRWILIGFGLVALATVAGTWKLHAAREQSPRRVAAKSALPSFPSAESSVASQADNADRQTSRTARGLDPHAARREATDYRQLVNQLLPLANSGSSAAQFEIASALSYCNSNSHLLISRTTGAVKTPEEIHELYTKLPPNTQSLVELAYQRCRSFTGDLSALKTSSTWLDRAAEAGYPPAVFMKAQVMMQTHLRDEDSAALQQAKQQAIIASISGDPSVLFGMADFVSGDGKPREQVEQLVSAWWLLACESGYDCSSESEAIKGICTIDAQCASKPTVVEELQRTNGANFGQVEQLAGQIRAALDSRDPEEIKKYL